MLARHRLALCCATLAGVLVSPVGPVPAAWADSGRAPAAVPVTDFDGDGRGDLAVEAGAAEYVSVLYGGRGTRHQEVPGTRPVAGDFDGDGRTDLAVRRTGDVGGVWIHWGRAGRLTAQPVTVPADVELDGRLTAGDFNGDGHLDLVGTAPEDAADVRLRVGYGPFGRDGRPARTVTLETRETFRPTDVVAGDFNDDGKDDLVTLHAFEESGRRSQLWTGSGQGLPATSSRYLEAGARAAAGDVNGDGKDDLVIRTVPNGLVEDLLYDHGTVKVLYGSGSGPGTRTTTLNQNSAGVPGVNEKGDQFGDALSVGDVNGDGYADVAVGVPGEKLTVNGRGLKDAGTVVVLKGAAAGLRGTGAVVLHQNSARVPGVAETGDEFGKAVSLTELTGDRRADLAVGAPREDTSEPDSGAVWVLPGTSTTVTGKSSYAVNPGDLGLDSGSTMFGTRFAR
ncbi:FG-GAP and VCBS repeat-containing protein [Streptomyces sp. JNUCC 64]